MLVIFSTEKLYNKQKISLIQQIHHRHKFIGMSFPLVQYANIEFMS